METNSLFTAENPKIAKRHENYQTNPNVKFDFTNKSGPIPCVWTPVGWKNEPKPVNWPPMPKIWLLPPTETAPKSGNAAFAKSTVFRRYRRKIQLGRTSYASPQFTVPKPPTPNPRPRIR